MNEKEVLGGEGKMKDWEEMLLKILDEALHQGKEVVYTSDLIYELTKRGYEGLSSYEVGQKMKDWNFPKMRLDKVGQERKRGWMIKEFLLASLMGREETAQEDSFSDVVAMKCEGKDFDFEEKVQKPCGWTGYVRLKKGERVIAPEMGGSPQVTWDMRKIKEEEEESGGRQRAYSMVEAINGGQNLCGCPRCGSVVYAYRPKEINFAGGQVVFK